jgi:hypothetical protein
MKVLISTEAWSTKQGTVAKAVVRTVDGKFLGVTNQTKAIKPSSLTLIGR